MEKNIKKRINQVILAVSLVFALGMVTYILFQKSPDTDYYLPAACKDKWTVIRYEVADASAFPLVEGKVQIRIPDSCICHTSNTLKIGWGKTRYFLVENGTETLLPNYEKTGEEYVVYFHDHDMRHLSHEALLSRLPNGADTVMFDGAHLKKADRYHVTYTPGRKSVEYFYLSAEPHPLSFVPPGEPPVVTLESTKDHAVPLSK